MGEADGFGADQTGQHVVNGEFGTATPSRRLCLLGHDPFQYLRGAVVQATQEVVRMQRFDGVVVQSRSRKIAEIGGDDDLRIGDNRDGEDVPILGVLVSPAIKCS
ncbi:hypothetical protein QMK19_29715 [Streptomyces sp. H10-C2]|uniref:hypothetical protein n=1 Tax=unclassified Streptomyces TaxID=2593676 RepID=UPI0024BAA027|nr:MULTISPECIES: hypothetical protein [unclassified Streptomyces]MDJ0344349.1 hypothetical protein [Streptomyces sp. PH10-H1]MDJ0373718.1 hypothetical protein [Streptomyces sp. H10-C2]